LSLGKAALRNAAMVATLNQSGIWNSSRSLRRRVRNRLSG
jgi:hypothetical protein